MSAVYTIGHSTRPLEEFLEMLSAHGIKMLADVRSFPASRRYPYFAQEPLAAALDKAGITYVWLESLGGRRRAAHNSPNGAWRNASFRGYADYMQTPGFAAGLARLEELARAQPAAIMCAEAVPWRCHRSLIADALIARGWEVRDIFDAGPARPHALNPMAKIAGGTLTYPPAQDTLI